MPNNTRTSPKIPPMPIRWRYCVSAWTNARRACEGDAANAQVDVQRAAQLLVLSLDLAQELHADEAGEHSVRVALQDGAEETETVVVA